MSSRFNSFANSPLGRKIIAIIDTRDRRVEFQAFSREGFPAVTALVTELTPVLMETKAHDPAQFNEAKKFVGWYVGNIMRDLGYEIEQRQRRVPGQLFTVAAKWGLCTVNQAPNP